MRNAVGYIVTIVAALCWGASGVSADYLMTGHGIELTLISFCRMFTAGVLTIASALARSRGITGSSHFGVWGWCSKHPGDRGQCRGTTIEHRSSPWAPHQPKVARNLGTLTFHRYRENRRIPTM